MTMTPLSGIGYNKQTGQHLIIRSGERQTARGKIKPIGEHYLFTFYICISLSLSLSLSLPLSLSLTLCFCFLELLSHGREETDKDKALNSETGKQFYFFIKQPWYTLTTINEYSQIFFLCLSVFLLLQCADRSLIKSFLFCLLHNIYFECVIYMQFNHQL